MRRFDVLIVGGGHAGAQAAAALRQHKFSGSIAILSEETDFPYERPPLSKDYLAGEKVFDRLKIRPDGFWAEQEVAMLLGQRAETVDAARHEVRLAGGTALTYGSLIWAAGGRPRRLSCEGHDLGKVHSVRSRADVDRMLADLPTVERVAVIGGGYIGLETAAVLTKLGKQVAVLEAPPRILARVAGEPISTFYEAKHRAHGVDLRTGVSVERKIGDGAAEGVQLSGGEILPADLVVVGIGIEPAVEALAAAGAEVSNGLEIDEYCRTTLPDVYAIGDCAAHVNRFARGARIRLESVQNAFDQATIAATDHLVGTTRLQQVRLIGRDPGSAEGIDGKLPDPLLQPGSGSHRQAPASGPARNPWLR